jgi:hypothetical protein
MWKITALFAGVALASSAKAATVTYTLNLHESATGQYTTANQFAIYASVSQGDNAGLFAYQVDLKGTADVGGPTTLTLANRTPSGLWEADANDPNFDPGAVYPTKFAGFGTGRAAIGSSGVVSGVTDLAKDVDLVRVYGFGQPPAHKMDDWRPPPDTSTGVAVAYAAYVGATNTDGRTTPYGAPVNTIGGSSDPTCGSSLLAVPAGSLRIATGTWTGTAPSIEQLSANTKANVWKLDHPNGTENEPATLAFVTRNFVVDCFPYAALNGTPLGTNQAVGGSISVSGSSNNYVSEVDQLLDPSVALGNAPIEGIGDEAGAVYVMAKLNGTSADIASLLNFLNQDVDASDSQFAALHAIYDSRFGAGGFNALFKFPNMAGAKIFNWDFRFNNVTVDQLAAVPEPGAMGFMVLGMALAAQRRRVRVAQSK